MVHIVANYINICYGTAAHPMGIPVPVQVDYLQVACLRLPMEKDPGSYPGYPC